MNMDQYIGRWLDNRYEILEIIGTGGMAVVYKARCHRLNRLVAIKILKDEFSRDEEFRRRFHAEGEAVAMLSHPNIVQVYDVSSTDNANFMVMELVDGISLKQYMEKKGILNWKETLHFAMQIAKGLEHAHGRGIVHRDIKPHNIMVLKNGSVKVMDFGIARVMSKSNTLTKEALGSVHYISPEQAKGGWVDNRSDLYSLSVVMYEMMAGRPPYDGESPVAVAIQHINGGAVMPSTLNPNIPGGLEQIIMKGMALEVNERYSSAGEMLRDMDEFRKDPAIIFSFPKPMVSQATQQISLDDLHRAPKTTAERVANSKTEAQRNRTGDTGRLRTGETGRVRTAGASTALRQRHTGSVGTGHTAQQRKNTRAREEDNRSRITAFAIVGCSIVAIVAIIIFLIALSNGFWFRTELVSVPNLVGEDYRNLDKTLVRDITISSEPEWTYHASFAKNQIIHQTPSAGSKVAKDATITLVISLGPEPKVKTMDELRGQKLQDAMAHLRGQGMNPLAEDECSEEIPEGEVIRTEPAAGDPLTDGQTVYVYYSSGPKIKKEMVPNVVGKKYDEAKKELDALGFKNVIPKYVAGEEPKDEVVYQSVAADTNFDLTEQIVLHVSEGPLTPETTDPPRTEPTKPAEPVNPPSDPPKQELVTRVVSISLPQDRTEPYVLTLYHNGREVVEAREIQPGTPFIVIELTGRGIQMYEIRINNAFYKMHEVDFTDNG